MSLIVGWEPVLFLISLLAAGLFAFLETAFTALRPFRLKELESVVSRYPLLATVWNTNPRRILITILIANNFAHVLCSVLITEVMQKMFGSEIGMAVGVSLATIIILVGGDIIPKIVAKSHHETFFSSTVWIINLLVRFFYPLVTGLVAIADYVVKKVGDEDQDNNSTIKEIEYLIDYSDSKGIIESEKSEMLQNIFNLGQIPVSKIMIPRIDMALINITTSIEQALQLFSKHRYSRLPAFDGKEDDIVGLLYHKDLLDPSIINDKNLPIRTFVRPVLFVPETKKINHLLSEFLKKRMHMAMVVNEHGAIIGLVTLEDLIEEIVGDIRDEHETVQTGVVALEEGGWMIDGWVALETIEDFLPLSFQVEEAVTLGGFLTERLEHVPKKGERLSYQGYCFQIQQASVRRVLKVLIFEEKPTENSQE